MEDKSKLKVTEQDIQEGIKAAEMTLAALSKQMLKQEDLLPLATAHLTEASMFILVRKMTGNEHGPFQLVKHLCCVIVGLTWMLQQQQSNKEQVSVKE